MRKLRLADEYMTGQAHPRFQSPVGTFVTERATDRYKMLPADPSRVDPNVSRSADLVALSGMEEHVKLVDGEWPKPEPVNGVYEVLVVEDALANFKMVVGNEFTISDEEQIKRPIHFKVVGVIDRKSYDDLYWYNYMSSYRSRLSSSVFHL
ncbi:hypothetical protein LJK88_28885 [Paenibacillus sp. P26]|nr:hypothetical protein LJK88_28885 [Paenibacillus sp. P26]